MKKFLIALLFPMICLAGNPPAPPPVKSEDQNINTINTYLNNIYNNFNNLEIVTTDPNGNRTGRYGDIVIYNNGGVFTIKICVSSPSGTIWQ